MVGERKTNKMTFKQRKEELLASLRGIRVEDPPTVILFTGTKIWKDADKNYHRDGDFPAVVRIDGTQFWYKKGKLHRDGDKPAIIWADGKKEWYKKGKRHRDGGKPAVICTNRISQWWRNGERVK
jgi:flagellar basal body L-ring protein FlgH